MKKLLQIFLAGNFLAANLIFTARAETNLPPVLIELQKKMATAKSEYLEFTQERDLKLFSEPLKSDGMMLMQRPDKIRWETISPYQTILLGDQKSVAQFEFNDGKWEKLKLGFPQILQHVMQQMSAMNQGDLTAMTRDYEISVATNNEIILTMVPKDKTVRDMMSSLEMKLAPDLSTTREVVMHEPNGDLTRITFHNEKRDVTFPAGTFDQTKPLPIPTVQAAIKNAP